MDVVFSWPFLRHGDGGKPNPGDNDELQWQPAPQRPGGESCLRDFIGGDRHVDVCRENGDQQRNQPPAGQFAKGPDKQPGATGDFADAADGNEEFRPGQGGWDDLSVKSRIDEMIGAGRDEKDGRRPPQDGCQFAASGVGLNGLIHQWSVLTSERSGYK